MQFQDIWDKIKCTPQTQGIDLSHNFWNFYLSSLNEQNFTTSTYNKENNIASKAINMLQTLKNNPNFYEYHNFIELLLKDIYYMGTLSEFFLKKITQIKSINDIKQLKELLGNNYIQSTTKNVEIQAEIIIAIENQSSNN